MTNPRPTLTAAQRPHDQHCVWCDVEEFTASRYGVLHHLSERAVLAIRQAMKEPTCSPGCVDCADEGKS